MRVGERLIGLRTDDNEYAQRVHAALEGVLDPSVQGPANLTLRAGIDEGQVQQLHTLYRGGKPVLRGRTRGRILRAAFAYLDGFAEPPPGIARLNARLFVDGDAAIVIDSTFSDPVARVERRAERMGYRVVDVPAVGIDRDTLEVVLWPPRLPFVPEGRAAIDREDPPAPIEVPLEARRLPLRGLLAHIPDTDEVAVADSPSRRLGAASPLVVGVDGKVTGLDLELLGRLSGAPVWHERSELGDHDLLGFLRELTST